MTGPYRTAEVRNLAERVCPWCNARIVVDLDAVAAVCDSCGARYATALARLRQIRVVAKAPRRGPRVLARAFYGLAYVVVGIGVPIAGVIGAMAMVGFAVVMFLVSWYDEMWKTRDDDRLRNLAERVPVVRRLGHRRLAPLLLETSSSLDNDTRE